MRIMYLMSKEVALVTPSLMTNNLASRVVVLPVGALDDDTCSPNLKKYTAETACMFLGGMTLASVMTTRVERSVEVH